MGDNTGAVELTPVAVAARPSIAFNNVDLPAPLGPTMAAKGEHLIDELEKRGVATLWLEVRASNAAAIALYEFLKCGFN